MNTISATPPGGQSLGKIGCAPSPRCSAPARREQLRLSGTLNGIDYVEVGDDGTRLCVHLFGDIPSQLGVANVRISGGDRITRLRVLAVSVGHETELHDDPCLRVVLDRQGDHSPYCLCLVDATSGADPASWRAYPGFDPRHACASLQFRLGCAKDFDCANESPCVSTLAPPPQIDYLARDYASFRQLLLDRIALDLPAWRERHVPDVGIALVEALAYTADQLSYYQDAVATEAYLGTARRRISVRRHARLVDYRMHEGCNARALVCIAADGNVSLPLANLLLLVPPPGQLNVRPGIIDAGQLETARAQGALLFEPMPLDGAAELQVIAAHSTIRLHVWGDEMCCLPRGSTRATLIDMALPAASPSPSPVNDDPAANDPAPNESAARHLGPNGSSMNARALNTAARAAAVDPPPRALRLAVGDLLIFEEVLGPHTGNPADADPAHRHAVRLTDVQTSTDPLDGTPLLEVDWDACDALPFDLCLSVRTPSPGCRWLHDVSVARGNVLLVDHGERVRGQCRCDAICEGTAADDTYPGLGAALAALPDACARCHDLAEDCWLVPGTTERGCCRCDGAVQDVTHRPGDTGHALPDAPLTWAEPLPARAPVCQLLTRDPRQALPQVTVFGGPIDAVLVPDAPDPRWQWSARGDLLQSGPDDRHLVVEIDDEGTAHLRFGDGTLGRQPQAGDFFRAASRVGNGSAGNVGRDAIIWLALKSGTLSVNLQPRNPLAAAGGTDPESLAEVKRFAPGAFRATPLRAIVADDYAMFAAQSPQLQGATASLDWCGSWYAADVVVDPLGRDSLPRPLAQSLEVTLDHYRRIGHDVAILAACYVPLQIELFVCVLPDFLTAHVRAQLLDRFSAGLRRDGRPGFFHPDRLRLGAPVFVSALLAEAQAITGVAHVDVVTLTRAGSAQASEVPADGVLPMAAREIAQVDNDPDHPDHGRIAFTLGGGR